MDTRVGSKAVALITTSAKFSNIYELVNQLKTVTNNNNNILKVTEDIHTILGKLQELIDKLRTKYVRVFGKFIKLADFVHKVFYGNIMYELYVKYVKANFDKRNKNIVEIFNKFNTAMNKSDILKLVNDIKLLLLSNRKYMTFPIDADAINMLIIEYADKITDMKKIFSK